MSYPFKAWSHSALKDFETCPRRYFLTRVSKEVAEPLSDAITHGNRVHKALELTLKEQRPLPQDMRSARPLVGSILKMGGKLEAEQKYAVTDSFQPTTYFAKDVWCRSVVDVAVEKNDKLFIGDWKTGKPQPDSDQLRLSAAVTLAHKPWVKRIVTAFLWLKDSSITSETLNRDDIPGVWQGFLPRVQRLRQAHETNKFIPRPSGLCRQWCPCTKCEYHGGS